MKIKLLIGFVLLLQSITVYSFDLTGTVTNAETGESIENAVVRIKELQKVIVTDSKGKFNVSSVEFGSYNLGISCVGYIREHFKVSFTGQNNIYFRLLPTAVQTPSIVITGNQASSKFDEIYAKSSILEGNELQKDMGMTLAATLKNETGLAIRSMGPAPARPVIRGLSGNRVLISQDGVEIQDLSATSPDHAVSTDAFTVERIEVLRGPKVLVQTPTTIGGVVNIIRNDIPITMPPSITGMAGSIFESVNTGRLGAFVLNVPLNPIAVRGEFGYRKTDNINTPIGWLKNTNIQNSNYSLGASYINNSKMVIGAAIREFQSEYGIPGDKTAGHPKGVNIEMFRRNVAGKLLYHFHHDIVDFVDMDFNYTYYNQVEYESNNSIGAEFVLRDYFASVKINQNKIGILDDGILGFSINNKTLKMGGYVFNPNSEAFNFASYIFENYSLWDIEFQTAARVDFTIIQPTEGEKESDIGLIRKRDFLTFSVSFSAVYDLGNNFIIGSNFSRSSRPPTIEELFSEGPHLAVYSFETGNPDLSAEHGWGSEIFACYKNNNLFAMITGFWNEMEYYIIPRNINKINPQILLPVYATNGFPARIYGLESQAKIDFHNSFSLSGSINYTFGELIDTGSPMPMMPPLKGLIALNYKNGNLTLGIESELAAAQNKIDKFEEITDGYSIFNLFGQYIFSIGSAANHITINIENMFDNEYRNHLSRIKHLIPESGRNIKILYKIFF